ncbi:Dual specificity tyrosine-phosphorylation-regulated kinase [Clydaea vesicula]|uniref:dual-specificity kinase n=1 Tax=Clydaea vesicula TaxID=447962 RepID=A0AAD5XWM0_9FUNG|nr:Dual specificity tyrosine-phosphorylation-regulated kinase [Clydaea vesicula]
MLTSSQHESRRKTLISTPNSSPKISTSTFTVQSHSFSSGVYFDDLEAYRNHNNRSRSGTVANSISTTFSDLDLERGSAAYLDNSKSSNVNMKLEDQKYLSSKSSSLPIQAKSFLPIPVSENAQLEENFHQKSSAHRRQQSVSYTSHTSNSNIQQFSVRRKSATNTEGNKQNSKYNLSGNTSSRTSASSAPTGVYQSQRAFVPNLLNPSVENSKASLATRYTSTVQSDSKLNQNNIRTSNVVTNQEALVSRHSARMSSSAEDNNNIDGKRISSRSSSQGGSIPKLSSNLQSSLTRQSLSAQNQKNNDATDTRNSYSNQSYSLQQQQGQRSSLKTSSSTNSSNSALGMNSKSMSKSRSSFFAKDNNGRSFSSSPKSTPPQPPFTPETTLNYYKNNLTSYEQKEVFAYNEVYFLGSRSINKIGSSKRQTGGESSEDNLTFTKGEVDKGVYNLGYDDTRGDYYLIQNDHIHYRYEILCVLGKGSFGQVAKCLDHKTNRIVALKIIRNKKRFEKQGMVEVKVLDKLRKEDEDDKYNLVHMLDYFQFRGHLCFTFELLGNNLYEWLKSGGFRGVNLEVCRNFSAQMLHCLNLLKEVKIIHCDLKPENVLLCDVANKQPQSKDTHRGERGYSATHNPSDFDGPEYKIKIIDFGSSCYESEKIYTYVQSRFYRSPEVILGISYSSAIDMWSLGCILVELYTGYPLFPGENEHEQLLCIMEIFGLPSMNLVDRGTRKKTYFDSNGTVKLVVNSKGKKRKPGSKSLSSILKNCDPLFIDFIEKCLEWDPEKRMTPLGALRHDWIKEYHSNKYMQQQFFSEKKMPTSANFVSYRESKGSFPSLAINTQNISNNIQQQQLSPRDGGRNRSNSIYYQQQILKQQQQLQQYQKQLQNGLNSNSNADKNSGYGAGGMTGSFLPPTLPPISANGLSSFSMQFEEPYSPQRYSSGTSFNDCPEKFINKRVSHETVNNLNSVGSGISYNSLPVYQHSQIVPNNNINSHWKN